MLDNFQNKTAPEQYPGEAFSYHLWHIAAGENERTTDERSTHLYWGWQWENVPAELEKVRTMF
jgi:hypothetical protein